ncbi:hypothetical protein [Thalassotalea profundi]|uniref:STAS/SEC14 domain-containing protein n=1 Tax=Thalassotalea profundi TaxID=2036687 RepID=A0ABQ3IX91_9GAMM|nr:hypothetical protein [Thalassotalea profundi]GHE97547.1 hypothetical protein GCM10011501_28940 [Thalassotalea profundi]
MLEHGYYTLVVQDNFVLSQLFGAWNVERTKNYAEHMQKVASELTAKPWARIVNLSSWEGGGTDVIQPLQDLQKWAEQNNCKHVVFINPPLIPNYMLQKHGDPYHGYKIFEDQEEAISWVKAELDNL